MHTHTTGKGLALKEKLSTSCPHKANLWLSLPSTAAAHGCMQDSKYLLRDESFLRLYFTVLNNPSAVFWTLKQTSVWPWEDCLLPRHRVKEGIKAGELARSWWHKYSYGILSILFKTSTESSGCCSSPLRAQMLCPRREFLLLHRIHSAL